MVDIKPTCGFYAMADIKPNCGYNALMDIMPTSGYNAIVDIAPSYDNNVLINIVPTYLYILILTFTHTCHRMKCNTRNISSPTRNGQIRASETLGYKMISFKRKGNGSTTPLTKLAKNKNADRDKFCE